MEYLIGYFIIAIFMCGLLCSWDPLELENCDEEEFFISVLFGSIFWPIALVMLFSYWLGFQLKKLRRK